MQQQKHVFFDEDTGPLLMASFWLRTIYAQAEMQRPYNGLVKVVYSARPKRSGAGDAAPRGMADWMGAS